MTNPTRKDDPIEFRMGELLQTLGELPELDWIKTQVEAGLKQAREDAFNLVRDALTTPSSDDRWTFLQYCLTGWAESGMTGFVLHDGDSGLDDADLRLIPGLPEDAKRREATYTVIEQGDDYYDDRAIKMILETGKVCAHCGTPLTQRDGTWVDRTNAYACPSSDAEHKPEQALYEVTHETIELGLQRIRQAIDKPDEGTGNWERGLTTVPYLHRGQRNLIIQADLTNDAGIIDANDYAAIVEIALFGEVRFG